MLWVFVLLTQAATAQQQQIDRGQALFLEANGGCGNCHALKGKGTAVGPDLTGIGRLAPQAIAMAARSTVTQYVQNVKLKSDETFPAMVGNKADTVQVFDLSKDPPQERKVDKAEIVSLSANDKWKHPPAAAKISEEKLADIVAYIRYAASGSKKAVAPEEVR
jgi:putative heme-binding domain-containing protein